MPLLCLVLFIILANKIKLISDTEKNKNIYKELLWFIPSFVLSVTFFIIFKNILIKHHVITPYSYPIEYFISFVILCPIYEEIMFRKFLLNLCLTNMNIIKSIIISSIIFAYFHFSILPIHEFLGGIIFSILYIWRKTIIAPIALHLGTNFAIAIIEMNLST